MYELRHIFRGTCVYFVSITIYNKWREQLRPGKQYFCICFTRHNVAEINSFEESGEKILFSTLDLQFFYKT